MLTCQSWQLLISISPRTVDRPWVKALAKVIQFQWKAHARAVLHTCYASHTRHEGGEEANDERLDLLQHSSRPHWAHLGRPRAQPHASLRRAIHWRPARRAPLLPGSSLRLPSLRWPVTGRPGWSLLMLRTTWLGPLHAKYIQGSFDTSPSSSNNCS